MSPAEYLRELAFPFRSSATAIALLVFALLLGLASVAGLFGIWLYIATIPAYARYLTMIAEARARGREAMPPGIEYFTLVGNLWTFFPAVTAVGMGFVVVYSSGLVGTQPAFLLALGFATVWPAMVGVLVITHSMGESLNPVAIARFIAACGSDYWYAPMTLVLIILVSAFAAGWLWWLPLPIDSFLAASLFAVTGAIMRKGRLVDDVDVPDALEPDADEVTARLLRERTGVLNHAYGFASRGNREGGLGHVVAWLHRDPDPDDAWPWFFEQMLRWEDTMPALQFAQRYLGRLLDHGEQVRAVKLLMRCRLVDARFRPLPADLPRAIEAAKACRNEDLAAALGR